MEYFVRVELFKAEAEDYEKVHLKMEENGFFRAIEADNGGIYNMPSGTYFGNSALETLQVQILVSGIADQFSTPEASVFVAQLATWQAFLHRS